MRRDDVLSRLAGVSSRDAILGELSYVERLSPLRVLDVWADGLPHRAPHVRVRDERTHRAVMLGELTSEEMRRAADVQAQLERWWEGGGAWPGE